MKSRQSLASGLQSLRDRLAGIKRRKQADEAERFRSQMGALESAIQQSKQTGRWRKHSYNIFHVLGCRRLELIHSRILAWLLDADESHGLGSSFLRALEPGISPADTYRVTLEWQEEGDRPDLIVEAATKRWRIIVENKVDGGEQPEQSLRYAERFGGRPSRNIFWFITPGGRKAESPRFRPVSYRQIADVLSGLRANRDASLLIDHFVSHIRNDLE